MTPQFPTLYLVGDSLMKTGSGNGEGGQWGWGAALPDLFDPAKIRVENRARGGRSSRSYREEGLWTEVLAQLKPGDFVIIGFGHNDAENSRNHPDRATITGVGDETIPIGQGQDAKTIHTFGWHLRQSIAEAREKGAIPILASPVPRNEWTDGKMIRGFGGYVQWASETAAATDTPFLDLNRLVADRFDALGEEAAAQHYADGTHTTGIGARLVAGAAAEGIRGLKDCPLADMLLPVGAARKESVSE